MLPQNDEIRRVFSSAATDDPDFLFGDCYRGGYVVIRPASYIRDEKGTILTDAHGNPRFQMSDGFCFSVEEQIIVQFALELLNRYYQPSFNPLSHEKYFDLYDNNIYPVSAIAQMVQDIGLLLTAGEETAQGQKLQHISEQYADSNDVRNTYARLMKYFKNLIASPFSYDLIVFIGN